MDMTGDCPGHSEVTTRVMTSGGVTKLSEA